MDIEKLKIDLNNCHEVLKLIDPGSSMYQASDAETLEELDDLEIRNIHAIVLKFTKEQFVQKYRALKPLLNGDLASIARNLSDHVHKNTFRNYIDGFPKDPALMFLIIKSLIEKAKNNRAKYLEV